MLRFTEQDVRRWCGHNALEAGRVYFRQARVIAFARDGDTIRSNVRGGERQPYKQTITISGSEDRPTLSGSARAPSTSTASTSRLRCCTPSRSRR